MPRSVKAGPDFYQAVRNKPAQWAYCAIDVQREYCDPHYEFNKDNSRGSEKTDKVASKIADLTPLFRSAGFPAFIIYYSENRYPAPGYAKGGLYKLEPAPGDTLIVKDADSAFQGSDIDILLRQRHIKGLLVSGFNLNACIYSTATDALDKGYQVVILGDCVGNDRCNYRKGIKDKIRDLISKGAVFTGSDKILQSRAVKA